MTQRHAAARELPAWAPGWPYDMGGAAAFCPPAAADPARQPMWTALHEAGHAVATLSGRTVPGPAVLDLRPDRPSWGSVVVIPADPGVAVTRLFVARALLAGAAAEARGGNPWPWPYAAQDYETAWRLFGAAPKPGSAQAFGAHMALGVAWLDVVAWMDRPEVWRAVQGMAAALLEDHAPRPAKWWRLCQRAAAEIHPPAEVARMATWPGAEAAGAFSGPTLAVPHDFISLYVAAVFFALAGLGSLFRP